MTSTRLLDAFAGACDLDPMHPNVLKIIAAAVLAVAASLESSQVLPAGASGAIGGFVAFLLGVIHPGPRTGGK